MTDARPTADTIELDLLLEAIFRRYGFDFRHYAHASLKRRVAATLARANVTDPAALIPQILRESELFSTFLQDLSITVTDLFRDP